MGCLHRCAGPQPHAATPLSDADYRAGSWTLGVLAGLQNTGPPRIGQCLRSAAGFAGVMMWMRFWPAASVLSRLGRRRLKHKHLCHRSQHRTFSLQMCRYADARCQAPQLPHASSAAGASLRYKFGSGSRQKHSALTDMPVACGVEPDTLVFWCLQVGWQSVGSWTLHGNDQHLGGVKQQTCSTRGDEQF